MATQKHIVVQESEDSVDVVLAGFSERTTVPVAEITRHHDRPLVCGAELWRDDKQHWHDSPPDMRQEKA